jgi:FAD-dependent oxidoreductase domain-containing protein 1
MLKRDVLVIGAGILGLSSAYHIKRTNPNLNVLIIDQFSGPAQGNTAKCAGGFRNMLTTEANIKLSESTIKWFKELQENQKVNLGLYNTGYLYLLSEPEYKKRKESFSIMEKFGVELKYHDKEDLRTKLPDLQIEQDDEAAEMGLKPIEIGVQGINCGVVNADAVAKTYETLFLKLGGEVQYNTTVNKLILKPKNELGIPGEPFVWQSSEIIGAETSRGRIEATTTIVATGAWSGRLLDAIGVDSYMRPKKRMIFVFDQEKLGRLLNSKGFNKYGKLPMVQLPDAKIYIKGDLQEDSLWVAETEDLGRQYGLEDDPQADERVYTENMHYGLVKYFPCFKDLRPVNMWAGQRAINSVDKQPVVVPTPGMIYVGAATGNGILKSDAIGRTVAALHNGEPEALLFDGKKLRVSDLGIKNRNVGIERF